MSEQSAALSYTIAIQYHNGLDVGNLPSTAGDSDIMQQIILLKTLTRTHAQRQTLKHTEQGKLSLLCE